MVNHKQPAALLELILFTRITDAFHSKSIQTFETAFENAHGVRLMETSFLCLSVKVVCWIYSQRHREYVLCCSYLRLFKFLKKAPAGQLHVFSFVMSERWTESFFQVLFWLKQFLNRFFQTVRISLFAFDNVGDYCCLLILHILHITFKWLWLSIILVFILRKTVSWKYKDVLLYRWFYIKHFEFDWLFVI